jgi:hypothetical protein
MISVVAKGTALLELEKELPGSTMADRAYKTLVEDKYKRR